MSGESASGRLWYYCEHFVFPVNFAFAVHFVNNERNDRLTSQGVCSYMDFRTIVNMQMNISAALQQ